MHQGRSLPLGTGPVWHRMNERALIVENVRNHRHEPFHFAPAIDEIP